MRSGSRKPDEEDAVGCLELVSHVPDSGWEGLAQGTDKVMHLDPGAVNLTTSVDACDRGLGVASGM